jgi:hypothetical protein
MRQTLEAERAARKLRERPIGRRTASVVQRPQTQGAEMSVPLPEVTLPRKPSLKNVTLKRGNTAEDTVRDEPEFDLVSLEIRAKSEMDS